MSRIVEMFHKIQERWNEIDMELVEEFQKTGKIPRYKPGEQYKHPQRKRFERMKHRIDRVCGKGSTYILIACFAVLMFLLMTGGTGIVAAFGIALATCFGGALVLNRFDPIREFILRWFKWVDMAAFVIAFGAANTIFGFQVAAIIGIMITGALILWKYNVEKTGIKDPTPAEVRATMRNLLKQLNKEYSDVVKQGAVEDEAELAKSAKPWKRWLRKEPAMAPAAMECVEGAV